MKRFLSQTKKCDLFEFYKTKFSLIFIKKRNFLSNDCSSVNIWKKALYLDHADKYEFDGFWMRLIKNKNLKINKFWNWEISQK